MDPDNPYGDYSPASAQAPKKSKKPLLIVLILLLVAVAAGFGYWYEYMKPKPAPATTPTPAEPTYNPPKVQLALFTTGLTNPTAIVSTGPASDERLFVVDRAGIIRIVKADGTIVAEPFLDISSQVLGSDEMGLLGLAFSPKYNENGFFFISYVDKQQNSTIARYKVSTDANKADPATAQVLLTLKQPYTNHNGGDVVFGKDGFLYVAFGDGGGQGDPEDRSQNLSNFFGKILRLDVSEVPYKVPPSNPYVGQAGKLPEIWDYGLRNPWRISFDRNTYEFFIADVGASAFEEVNVENSDSKGGNNYGWRCFEANRENNLAGCGSKDKYVFPSIEYDHKEKRCSVTGGYVYRGQNYPALNGKYFYGDYCNGQLFFAEKKDGKWAGTLVASTPYMFSTFGQDNHGELYVADFKTGTLYRIQDSAN